MKNLIQALNSRIQQGKPSMLITLTEQHGSSPRSAGALMLVGEEGRIAGTVGGGMLEFQAIQKAQAMLQERQGGVFAYSLTNDRAAELGMVCGGSVQALFAYLAASDSIKAVIERISLCIEGHQTGWLLLPCSGTQIAFYGEDGLTGDDEAGLTFDNIMETDCGVLEGTRGRCYVQKLQNNSIVYVFGGGHLARELVPLLSHLAFRCVVVDDRPEYAKKESFPDAENVLVCDYADIARHVTVRERDYVIAVTRGHLGDLAVERFALNTPACYIGVVGSRTKIQTVQKMLLSEGFTKDDLSRVTSPIGIPIQSETPAEIAVSIAAQLIDVRASLREQ